LSPDVNGDFHMNENTQGSCHGRAECMIAASSAHRIGAITAIVNRTRLFFSHSLWHIRQKGLVGTFRLTLLKLMPSKEPKWAKDAGRLDKQFESVLNLQPGEWVQIRPEDEIMLTLDANRKNRGLLWMNGMRRFCGGEFRVYKRLRRILLESTGEYREIKNTVLLEGVNCDGKEFNGCDRSCFHYWREIWLKRIPEPAGKNTK